MVGHQCQVEATATNQDQGETMKLGATVNAIDLFCGFGGSSQGIHDAGATLSLAANHDPHSIDVHARNYPEVDHVRADISDPDSKTYRDPATFPHARFLWASPSCRYHSPANARKVYRNGPQISLFDEGGFDHELYARSERSRVTMMCPLRYADHQSPELVIVENVVEAAKWGPGKDGTTFQWWLREWDKLGYDHEAVFLNSMFFDVPQSRDRMYVVFWKKGNRRPNLDYRPLANCPQHAVVEAVQTWKKRTKAWPIERWGKYRSQYTYSCPWCSRNLDVVGRPAFDAIDWSDLGPTLSQRSRPLAPKTIDRIRRGLAKFRDWPAVVLPAAGNTSERPGQLRARHVGQPLFTQTATAEFGFTTRPFMVNLRGGGSRDYAAGIDQPIQTVTGQGLHHAMVTKITGVYDYESRGITRPVSEPLSTLVTRGSHALVASTFTKFNGGPGDTAWHPMSDTLQTVTARDTTGLLTGHHANPDGNQKESFDRVLGGKPSGRAMDLDDVHFRMLKPDPELRRAMAFGNDYELFGTKTQVTAGLGNAVTPPVASWLTAQALATLDG
jgi:site-specific DNA-cytosine methylase